MNRVRLQALSLLCLGLVTMVSCGSPAKQADALVTADGKVAGVVVRYESPIDEKSITKDTYEVPGHSVATFFVSDSNPFRKDSGEELEKGGRYVVLFVKDDPKSAQSGTVELVTPGSDFSSVVAKVKQVAPVKSLSGKEIKPWGKATTTTESFMIPGGQISK